MKRWLIIAVVLVAVGGVVWWGRSSSQKSEFDVKALGGDQVMVTYKVQGSASTADITYQTSSGSSQQSGLAVPLVRKSDSGEGIRFTFSRGSFVYLSAQNGGGSGTIECVIEASDGTQVARNTASGGYAIATCSGKAR